MRLTEEDYEALEKCYITRELAIAAGLYRVVSIDGRELVGRSGGGNYAGIIFPLYWPGTSSILIYRLRLDQPPIDLRSGKPEHKYLMAHGTRNRFYMPLEDPADLADPKKPVFFLEGEKKYLAMHRAAHEISGNGTGHGAFLPIGLFGVWGWRGIVGITTDPNGLRVEQKGVIPDIDKVVWQSPSTVPADERVSRKVYLLFDANVITNTSVKAARAAFARELEGRGATVYLVNLPIAPGINGVDDYLALSGLAAFIELVKHAWRYDWREELAHSDKGKVLATFGNALIALRIAPAWQGVLGYNEFSQRVEALRQTPWDGPADIWSDYHDSRTVEWLEHAGLPISRTQTTDAVLTVAREHPYHPVKNYFASLKWDGTKRVDTWLIVYCGVKDTPYARAVGRNWLIGGRARIGKPGCRVDHTMIFEGPQGGGKSTTFQILGGEFYTDDIADLGTKDASMAMAGVWIVELAELDAMSRTEISKIKAFLSRAVDHFRPPYGRHMIWVPRQCIFGGSVNVDRYLKDETGGRRFWPVVCGKFDLEALRRDRDQLWAEADYLYHSGAHWWLEDDDLIAAAALEQEDRYQTDPWEDKIEEWLENLTRKQCTTAEVLEKAIFKEVKTWERRDETRVGVILHRLGWLVTERTAMAKGERRQRIYRPKTEK
jgi:predicted P-loop ATPase